MSDFYATPKGKILIKCLKYMFLFAVFYIFSIGGIMGKVFPFAFSFYIALCWCDQNLYLTSVCYLGASMLINFSLQNLICTAFCILVVVITNLIHKKIKKRMPLALVGLYAVLSQTMFLYFNLIYQNQILNCIIHIVLGEIFLYACIDVLKKILVRGMGLKLTIDECVSLGAFMIALGTGLANANVLNFPIFNIVCVLIVLLTTYIYENSSVPFVCMVCFGLGYAIQTADISKVAIFTILALASTSFKSTNRYFSVLAVLICDVVLGLYFSAYGAYTYRILVCTALGELLFLCISNNTLNLLKIVLNQKNGLAIKNVLNVNRENIKRRLYTLSEIFDEMDRSFKNTIEGVLPASEAKFMLKDELIDKVCGDCPEKHRCYRVVGKETNEILDNILSAGLDRGKVSLLDIPPFLSTRCNRTNILINTANQLIANYKQYTYCASSVDTSRALVAQEFKGVSKLLAKLADETSGMITLDDDLEKKIIEELNYVNILATEIYIFKKSSFDFLCTLTVKTSDLNNPRLIEVLEKNLFTKLHLSSSEPAEISGFTICTFLVAPKYNCIYGSAGAAKFGNTVSGDSFLFVKLNGNKILLSICDGMGSGDKAQKMSDTTISLIENFYRAEFDDETILQSVNKLLSMQLTDGYSALDLCVINLNNLNIDFIKEGAPCSFIKHTNSTDILSGSGALPVGILQDVSPSVDSKILSENDIVIICSDGITDAFIDDERLKNFINSIQSNNPQEIADLISNEAIRLNAGEPKDDMTVVCARVYVNI